MKANVSVNVNGLSYDRWLAAAGYGETPAAFFIGPKNKELKTAWQSGVDPSEYRKEVVK